MAVEFQSGPAGAFWTYIPLQESLLQPATLEQVRAGLDLQPATLEQVRSGLDLQPATLEQVRSGLDG